MTGTEGPNVNATLEVTITQLGPRDLSLMGGLLDLFADAFSDPETYREKRPSHEYMEGLLASDMLIALVAVEGERVTGGLVAYELKKFEQERSEVYIYDLAVASSHRRRGIATSLIQELKKIARERRAYVIYVQADTDIEDEPAVALYSSLGSREEVLHFDIDVDP